MPMGNGKKSERKYFDSKDKLQLPKPKLFHFRQVIVCFFSNVDSRQRQDCFYIDENWMWNKTKSKLIIKQKLACVWYMTET